MDVHPVTTVIPTPTVGAAVSPSSTVCPGTVVSLSGTGAASYTWSGGVTNGISFIPVSTTTYTVTGTAVNGCTSTSTAIVTVSTPLSATGSISGPLSLCDGASATFSISPVTGATQYSWTIPVGTTLVSGQNTPSINIIYGSTSGSITVTPGNSCGTGTQASVAVTVNPNLAPIVGYTALPSEAVCAGTAVTLSGTGAQTYTWSGGITNAVSFVPDSTRNYIVTGTGSNGCTNSSNVTITVNPIPAVGITVLPSTTLCEGDSVNLSGTGAFTYTWTGGITDGASFVPLSDDTFIVTGTANGCTNSDTVSITVKPGPIVGYLISPFSTVCENTPVTLSGTGASFYSWSGGITDGISFQPTVTTTYTVTGTDTTGCSSTNSVNVVVNSLPTIISQPANQTVAAGTTVLFIVSSSAPGAMYQWQVDSISGFVDLLNAGQYSGVTNDTLSISNANMSQNNYHFRCVVTDGNCSDTSAAALLLIQVGLADVYRNISYYVYPNPSYDLITIQASVVVANTSFSLLDAAGKQILSGELTGPNTTLDIRHLAAGFYFLKVGDFAKAPIGIIKQ
jgi:PKD-like domain/Secretion system C-terminal sorting domain